MAPRPGLEPGTYGLIVVKWNQPGHGVRRAVELVGGLLRKTFPNSRVAPKSVGPSQTELRALLLNLWIQRPRMFKVQLSRQLL